MAKVLERRETLYDQDLLAWAEQQAAHLHAGQLERLDAETFASTLPCELNDILAGEDDPGEPVSA